MGPTASLSSYSTTARTSARSRLHGCLMEHFSPSFSLCLPATRDLITSSNEPSGQQRRSSLCSAFFSPRASISLFCDRGVGAGVAQREWLGDEPYTRV